MARRFSIPVMAWVISGLTVITSLPVLLSSYLIERSDEEIIEQTQVSHLIVARSVATQIDAYSQLLQSLLLTAGDNPSLYLDPTSDSALEILEGLLISRDEIRTVGLYRQDNHGAEEIFVLRKPGFSVNLSTLLADEMTARPTLVGSQEQTLLRVQRETSRPNVFISMLLTLEQLDVRYQLEELGDSAELIILDAEQQRVRGPAGVLDTLSVSELKQAIAAPVKSSAHRFQTADGLMIAALAHIREMDWVVLSIQPARDAERATTAMKTMAWQSTLAMAALSLLLAAGAWFGVIRPIRGILRAQQKLIGDGFDTSGSEIHRLQASFEQLEQAMSERDIISEVFLGRYQVIRKIGSGAMGTVYLGHDPKLKRELALKTIKISATTSSDDRRRLTESLINEGIHSAQLLHPNIVTVFDIAGNEHYAFIAMELVRGQSLEHRLRHEGLLSVEQSIVMADGVLAGLQAAHAAGIIHRDIKPGNVLIDEAGTVKVTDFGIAGTVSFKESQKHIVLGTPGYIAPECYQAAGYSEKTDLFAVGVMIVECLTGNQVFAGRSTQQIMSRTQVKDVRLPVELEQSLPPAMLQLIHGLLQKNPEKRIESAEIARELIHSLSKELSPSILLQISTDRGPDLTRYDASTSAPTSRLDTLSETTRLDVADDQ